MHKLLCVLATQISSVTNATSVSRSWTPAGEETRTRKASAEFIILCKESVSRLENVTLAGEHPVDEAAS